MTPRLLNWYHSLPPWAQSVAATARGWNLRRWRYCSSTDALVQQAREREKWSAGQWEAWRGARLTAILDRAARRVPYYREWWVSQKDATPDDWKSLSNWPILAKETLRAKPLAFVADDCDPAQMFPEHTSGTTGTPLHLWWSRETTRYWYALFEARWKNWYGVSRHDRWGMLGGQRVVPASRSKPPYWVWNAAMHQLYMSAFHMSDGSIPAYLDAMRRYRLRYLWGYSASIHQLACVANELGLTIPLEVVITNAEPLYPHQREAISKAFACPVRETYGMAEIVCAAGECERGKLHLWPEAGVVEVMDGESPVSAGEPGELIATGLVNGDMPLIRYRTGDRLALEAEGASCLCGRLLPLLRWVEGRKDDMIVTGDGRRIGRADPLFKAGLPIREAQVIQREAGKLDIQFVPDSTFGPADLEAFHGRFRDFLGPMELTFNAVSSIPRDASGKFKSVVSLLPPQSRPKSGTP